MKKILKGTKLLFAAYYNNETEEIEHILKDYILNVDIESNHPYDNGWIIGEEICLGGTNPSFKEFYYSMGSTFIEDLPNLCVFWNVSDSGWGVVESYWFGFVYKSQIIDG